MSASHNNRMQWSNLRSAIFVVCRFAPFTTKMAALRLPTDAGVRPFMEVSKLGFWALLTLPFYGSITWQASLSELGSRGVPRLLVRFFWIFLFPFVAFSRTDDDYAIMDVAPDLGDCIWSLGTFSLLAGFVTLPIFALIDGIPIWLSGLLIAGWPAFKFLSIPFTKRTV